MLSAGLVAERNGARTFLPTSAVRALTHLPKIEPLPDAPAGILGFGLAFGEVLLVVSVGEARGTLAVCDWFGESIGIVGLAPLSTGSFEEAQGGVLFEGNFVPTFDFNEVGQLLLRTRKSP